MVLPHLNQSLCCLEAGSRSIGRGCLVFFATFVIIRVIRDTVSTTAGSETNSTKLIVPVAFALIYIILDILMLVGVNKKRPSLMFPWIVFQVPLICLFLFAIFQGFIHQDFVAASIGGILACIFFYFLLVVNSHYHNLKSGLSPTV